MDNRFHFSTGWQFFPVPAVPEFGHAGRTQYGGLVRNLTYLEIDP